MNKVKIKNYLIKGKEKIVIQTPPADGSILPGITRDSIIDLLPEFYPEYEIDVSNMHLDRFISMHDSGQMIGSFVSGTASVVGEVHSILVGEKTYKFDYSNQDYVRNIKKMITDVQHGYVSHKFTSVLK